VLGQARISSSAIAANAARLVDHHRDFVADVSFDGYGHGVVAAAGAARAGGASRFAVASDAEATILLELGFLVVRRTDAQSSAAQLYGLDGDRAFVPAMTVVAPVVGLKQVHSGDGVSYGYTFRATRSSSLAMLGIGYADGLDRAAGNRGNVLLGGTLCPIVGRVAMNVMMVDLGDSELALGVEAIVIGPERRPVDWAAQIGRVAAEVVVEFGSRLPRVWS